jgi:hypothetical protein
MNKETGAYRFYAHLADVLGAEVGSKGLRRQLPEVEPDAISCEQRTFAYRKPVSNLLQEGNYDKPVPALTREDVEQYVKHQAFYGFYPAIATAGGEEKPGYGGWKRYFRSVEQFERDRPIFKKWMPIIRQINRAGWEPVTHATTSDPKSLVERFGSWKANNLCFTVRNQSPEKREVTLRVALDALGAAEPDWRRMAVTELVSETPRRAALTTRGQAEIALSLPPFDTQVVAVTRQADEP